MSRKIFIVVVMLALLAACGIKRPLELPGHGKYKDKPAQTQEDQSDQSDSDQDIMPDQVTPPSNPTLDNPAPPVPQLPSPAK